MVAEAALYHSFDDKGQRCTEGKPVRRVSSAVPRTLFCESMKKSVMSPLPSVGKCSSTWVGGNPCGGAHAPGGLGGAAGRA